MASSSSFSGSAVGSDASRTFADLVTKCFISLNDEGEATWDDEMIATWLNDAIRDYSKHFPRIRTQSIACADDDNTYDLLADFMGVLSVEYPTGEDPKEYLSRLSYTHGDFWTGTKWYDIVPRRDDSNRSELWISPDPSTGESISVEYNAHHILIADTSSVSGDTTITPNHQDLLIKFVLWQAALHLMFAEQQSPTSNSSLLMAQLSQNSRRLETAYHTALRQALFAADGESRHAQWIPAAYSTQDSLGRIY